jgi:methionyl-tRNA formyltransferase
MSKKNIVIATIKRWNISNAEFFKKNFQKEYTVHIITRSEALTFDKMQEIKPEYIFFPHWSWIIPKEIYENYECIVFHMTDLPYGRGGSPLQNLILNKKYDTKISAIQVEKGLDTGKIYLKEKCDISLGSAEEIFIEIANIIFNKMIPFIIKNKTTPCKQQGEAVVFKRRNKEQSNVLKNIFVSLQDLYDFIRMLDGEGYPKAFLNVGKFKIVFSEVLRKKEKLVGRFEIYEE